MHVYQSGFSQALTKIPFACNTNLVTVCKHLLCWTCIRSLELSKPILNWDKVWKLELHSTLSDQETDLQGFKVTD